VQLDIRCPNYLILSIDAFILNQELPSNLINKRTDIMRLNSNQFQFLGTNKISPRRGVLINSLPLHVLLGQQILMILWTAKGPHTFRTAPKELITFVGKILISWRCEIIYKVWRRSGLCGRTRQQVSKVEVGYTRIR
jgi:hypothetical protein